jgi:hypothetical protein
MKTITMSTVTRGTSIGILPKQQKVITRRFHRISKKIRLTQGSTAVKATHGHIASIGAHEKRAGRLDMASERI